MHVALNLLHLVPGETGGHEIYARRLVPALLKAGGDLKLTAFAGGAMARERWDGVDFVELSYDPRNRVRRVLAEQTILPLGVRRTGAELLHNLSNTAPIVAGVPQVTTVHDVNFRRFPETGVTAKGVEVLVPLAARRSRRVLTDSEASKADITAFLGIHPARVDVATLGPGIPDDARGPSPVDIRRRFGLGDAPLLLSVLAQRPHKNAGRLIDALARVPDAVLLLPGYETAHANELRRRMEAADVEERVRLLGWVDDALLDGLYRAADCFVFPSLAEGFGLPVLEAMVRGTPVACSNTTALPEVVGDAALQFDPLDVTAIAQAVGRILDDESLAADLRAAGYARARLFTWEEAARRTLECYERALA